MSQATAVWHVRSLRLPPGHTRGVGCSCRYIYTQPYIGARPYRRTVELLQPYRESRIATEYNWRGYSTGYNCVSFGFARLVGRVCSTDLIEKAWVYFPVFPATIGYPSRLLLR